MEPNNLTGGLEILCLPVLVWTFLGVFSFLLQCNSVTCSYRDVLDKCIPHANDKDFGLTELFRYCFQIDKERITWA